MSQDMIVDEVNPSAAASASPGIPGVLAIGADPLNFGGIPPPMTPPGRPGGVGQLHDHTRSFLWTLFVP